MGDCASRPKTEIIADHVSEKLEKHDDQFYRQPDLSFASDVDLIDDIRLADELDHARGLYTQIDEYKKWIFDYERFLSARLSDPSWKSVKRLLVEVQKGKELHYPHTCINEAQLYVRMRLEPGMPAGKEFLTSLSRNDIPKWGRCFELKLMKDYTTLILTVMVKRKRFSEVEYGTVTIKLRTLANQLMVQDWFQVTTKFTQAEKPCLYLRLQYITEERQLVEECRTSCIEKRSQAEIYLRKLREKIDRAEERIAPEGRG